MSNITIVSDGTARGTQVLVGDQALKQVTRIEFETLEPDGLVTATISVCAVALRLKLAKAEIQCDDPEAKAVIQEALLGFAKKGD